MFRTGCGLNRCCEHCLAVVIEYDPIGGFYLASDFDGDDAEI